jgi:cell division protein FtsI/penicillin-binding protein 2
MAAIVRTVASFTLGALLVVLPSGRSAGAAPTNGSDAGEALYWQSASQILARDFSARDISYLLLDAQTGAVRASRWDSPQTPIPVGSLVKPFAALAYGEQHHFQFPVHTCRGVATGCWLPRGHGRVGLTDALAYSCNSYFRALTANLSADQVSVEAQRWGIDGPAPSSSPASLLGLDGSWRISPLHLSRGYLELSRRREQPGVASVLEGMSESARHGTSAGIDRALEFSDALAKTGTAMCVHSHRAPGDGFVVALTPADHPRLLLLVRVHGVPGSEAAKTAGQMLGRIGE